jgi:hypothetical protein
VLAASHQVVKLIRAHALERGNLKFLLRNAAGAAGREIEDSPGKNLAGLCG